MPPVATVVPGTEGGTTVVGVCGTDVDTAGVVVVSGTVVVDGGIVVVDVVELVVVMEVLVVLAVVVVAGTATDGLPPRAASTSAISEPATYGYRLSPGQVVLLMSRCPQMVGVVTAVPGGHLLEPRDVKMTSAPGAVDKP